MCTPICNLIAIEYPVFQARMGRMRETQDEPFDRRVIGAELNIKAPFGLTDLKERDTQ
tara:strand:+ start:369 stop:542 length:174 start_codon:yes stop_codon:yes gene_type:complete